MQKRPCMQKFFFNVSLFPYSFFHLPGYPLADVMPFAREHHTSLYKTRRVFSATSRRSASPYGLFTYFSNRAAAISTVSPTPTIGNVGVVAFDQGRPI